MAVIVCQLCHAEHPFYEIYQPLRRDALGRIIQERNWSFNPETGRCISDSSDRTGRSQPYYHMCFVCNQRAGWVYSSEPPPQTTWTPSTAQRNLHEREAVAQGQDANPEYVWSVRKGGKTCGCRGGRCQLRGGGIGGCGCASNGVACSVMCGCGGRGDEGDCLNPYTPPAGADPGSKKCSCTSGCVLQDTYVGSLCGCASLGVGCSDACRCQGACRNGHR